jgi:hypothetical protein
MLSCEGVLAFLHAAITNPHKHIYKYIHTSTHTAPHAHNTAITSDEGKSDSRTWPMS